MLKPKRESLNQRLPAHCCCSSAPQDPTLPAPNIACYRPCPHSLPSELQSSVPLLSPACILGYLLCLSRRSEAGDLKTQPKAQMLNPERHNPKPRSLKRHRDRPRHSLHEAKRLVHNPLDKPMNLSLRFRLSGVGSRATTVEA